MKMPRIRLKSLDWHPYIEPVEIETATAEQLSAMKVTPSGGKISSYVRTLAHDPESYVARTELFNTIMYVEGGLRQQDRELGALGASLQNGCRYCSVVHAQRQTKHAGSSDTIAAIMQEREDVLSKRDAAILAFARALSVTPPEANAEHITALREVGMDELEILDLIHAIAIFGWANRLMHVLGHAETKAGT